MSVYEVILAGYGLSLIYGFTIVNIPIGLLVAGVRICQAYHSKDVQVRKYYKSSAKRWAKSMIPIGGPFCAFEDFMKS